MAPPIHGLNIIHSPPPAADSHDLLGQSFPDLAAQLDLWSNLTFDSDEGPAVAKPDDEGRSVDDDGDPRSPSLGTTEAAIRDGHVNVVTGTNLSTDPSRVQQHGQHPQFDLHSLLAGFGIDSFTNAQQSAAAAAAPTLAQLLALQGANFGHPTPQNPAASPITLPIQQQQNSRAAEKSQASGSEDGYPPQKRTRSRRTSEILAGSSSTDSAVTPEHAAVLAAEDKRRRNTAASARFRLKKKEREVALEGRAKELEMRVTELERECETLRRENGWLKGLVIGVTGVAQGPVVNTTTTAVKRTRDEA